MKTYKLNGTDLLKLEVAGLYDNNLNILTTYAPSKEDLKDHWILNVICGSKIIKQLYPEIIITDEPKLIEEVNGKIFSKVKIFTSMYLIEDDIWFNYIDLSKEV